MTSLVLASASPARLRTLQRAGVDPEVVVSQVDEAAMVAEWEQRIGIMSAGDVAGHLAQAKARDVATRCRPATLPGTLILGCDSVLAVDAAVHGKPGTVAVARERWRAMRGRSAVLHTGHCLIQRGSPGHDREVCATGQTRVDFADLSDAEIDAYVATGEPLTVAGGFTVDGLGGPYVSSIHGDYHNVVGVSLPLLRVMLAELGVAWHDLRAAASGPPRCTG